MPHEIDDLINGATDHGEADDIFNPPARERPRAESTHGDAPGGDFDASLDAEVERAILDLAERERAERAERERVERAAAAPGDDAGAEPPPAGAGPAPGAASGA